MADDQTLAYQKLDPSFTLNHRATIVTSEDGGSLRGIITGGAMHATGRYSSAKTGRAHPWKRCQELDRIVACEADPQVASYLAQPHRIDFHLPSGDVMFFPDLRVDLRSGDTVIELISHDIGLVRRDLVDWARAIYDSLGWTFIDRRDERDPDLITLANAKRVARDRWVKIDAGTVLTAQQAIAVAGDEISYGDLIDALGGKPVGPALLHALIVGGHLALDLGSPIRHRTPVRLQNGQRRP